MNPLDDDLIFVPHAPEAEQSVIGALLIDNAAIDRIAFLEPAHFFGHPNRELFTTIRAMLTHGKPADIVTVAEELGSRADELGGILYLGKLVQAVPSAANIQRYAGLVVEKSQLRGLLEASARIAELVRQPGDVTTKINQAQAEVMRLSETSGKRDPRVLREILLPAAEAIERRSSQVLDGITTGITDLDAKLHGLKNGELIIVAGRPAMGQSVLAVQIAENVASGGR